MTGMTGYRWWYLDVETEEATVVATLFDGFPFLPDRLDHGGIQLDVYRGGRRSVSVMALAPPGADVGARLTDAPGQIDVQLEAWASLPGATVKGSVTVAGLPYERSPLPGWWPLIPRGRGLVDLAIEGDGLRLELGRPCLTAPFYVRLPTRPRGLAEIGRPGAITVPGLRHLVAMRPTAAGPDPPDKDRILHRAERRFLRRDS